jgi:Prohead core protein serine protease
MKLITELFEDVEYITEARESGEKDHYIHGVFLQANVKNRNGRIYPLHIMENEVNRYMSEVVSHKRGYGELGHPAGPQINLDRVSHLITELKRDGDNFVGKAKLTDTPMGNIARGLLKSGAQLGVSSRGMGTLTPSKDGVMMVGPDFHLATAADIVADPSAPNAFVKGIMENVEWVYDPVKGSWHEEKLHNMKKAMHKMTMNEIEEKQFAIFENYLSSLTFKQ